MGGSSPVLGVIPMDSIRLLTRLLMQDKFP